MEAWEKCSQCSGGEMMGEEIEEMLCVRHVVGLWIQRSIQNTAKRFTRYTEVTSRSRFGKRIRPGRNKYETYYDENRELELRNVGGSERLETWREDVARHERNAEQGECTRRKDKGGNGSSERRRISQLRKEQEVLAGKWGSFHEVLRLMRYSRKDEWWG